MSEIQQLLLHAQPGADASVAGHIDRGERIAAEINQRWDLSTVRAWKVKHLRWFLIEHCKIAAPTTRYDYWRTIRVLAAALDRLRDWEPHLRGPWVRSGSGGRKAKLAGRARGR
jgi:hypothetical protein